MQQAKHTLCISALLSSSHPVPDRQNCEPARSIFPARVSAFSSFGNQGVRGTRMEILHTLSVLQWCPQTGVQKHSRLSRYGAEGSCKSLSVLQNNSSEAKALQQQGNLCFSRASWER